MSVVQGSEATGLKHETARRGTPGNRVSGTVHHPGNASSVGGRISEVDQD